MTEIESTAEDSQEVPDDEMIEMLPEDIRAKIQAIKEQREEQLATLTVSLVKKRKKAVEWRENTGIEQEWMDVEDAYEGIDDANRATENTASIRMAKPRSPNGGAMITSRMVSATRSTVFLNITRPYVDAAAARISDMLLPTDDRNYAIRPTPIPELSPQDMQQFTPEVMQANGVSTKEQLMELIKAEAEKRAKLAQTKIDDWLVECQYHGEVRKVVEDCVRLGTGILKGPVPVSRKQMKADVVDNQITLILSTAISPESVCVSPWDIYPDPACGEKVKNGSFLYERSLLSARQLRELRDQPGYRADEIDKALKEGPAKINVTSDGRRTGEDDRYEVWYYYGQISEDDLALANQTYEKGDSAKRHVDVVCTMVNDRLIKAAPSHLDSGEFPFDVVPWQRRTGMPFGIGVGKQINIPQRMLNAATRNMNDNARVSGAPQIVLKKGVVTPADGVMEITGGKVWFADPDQDINDVRGAFTTFDIPSRQNELMAIIQFALKMGEDVTGLPMLMQGSQGKAPDTVGGMQILNQNGNTVLKRFARIFDDNLTEPHIRRYYEWVMIFGDESMKGDFKIDARGSTALIDREIQRQVILGMGSMVVNPAFGIDPLLWAKEFLKLNKIDPKSMELTPEREKVIAMQAQAAQQQAFLMQMQPLMQKLASQERIKAAELDNKKQIQSADQQHDAQKFVADVALKKEMGSGVNQ